MPKANTPRDTARRHNPLADDVLATGHLRTKSATNSSKRRSRTSKSGADSGSDSDGDGGVEFVDAKASRRILQIGQDLQDEEEAERKLKMGEVLGQDPEEMERRRKMFEFESRFEAEREEEMGMEDVSGEFDEEEAWKDEEEEVEEVEVDPTDLSMFNKFMSSGPEDPIFGKEPEFGNGGTNLADLILEKIAAHEAQAAGQPKILGGGAPEDAVQIPAKVVEVYTKVGQILSRYKSGPLPKPFKILPTLPDPFTLISITNPAEWTPHACFAATKIFISAHGPVAQEFLTLVLLDHVRDNIHETKKLNVHLYNALKKALYKPAAFFKGFLFPLVSTGSCTLREATIISSVLARVSIPVLHSAAALLRLCDIAAEETSLNSEGGGATNIFIRVLLEKKYALPYKVIDALVFHFLRFRNADPTTSTNADAMTDAPMTAKQSLQTLKLPVLWHQSLLIFAQRYRNDITEDQREALLDLVQLRGHKDIGPEVRRELLAGRGRGVVAPPEEMGQGIGMGDGGDDTMVM